MLSNFCKLSFPFESFQARTFPYSDDRLVDLRAKHNTTHSFFRVGDKIYSIWAEGNDLDEGEECQINDSEITVIERAAKHLFYRTSLRNLEERVPEKFYPLQLISPSEAHDIAAKFLPAELKGVIQFQRLTEFEFRKFHEDSRLKIGITANLRRTWNCSKNLKDLIQDGFDPIGLPVKSKSEIRDLDGVAPNKNFAIGRVTSIVDESKCLVNTNQGEKEYFTDLLEVRKSRNEVFKILSFYQDAKAAQRLFDRIYEAGGLTSNAKKYYSEIQGAVGYLRKWKYSTKCGFSFSLNENLNFDLPSIKLNPTTFVFDATPGSASPSSIPSASPTSAATKSAKKPSPEKKTSASCSTTSNSIKHHDPKPSTPPPPHFFRATMKNGVKGLGPTNLKLWHLFLSNIPELISRNSSDAACRILKIPKINDLQKDSTLSHILDPLPKDPFFTIRQSATDEFPSLPPAIK